MSLWDCSTKACRACPLLYEPSWNLCLLILHLSQLRGATVPSTGSLVSIQRVHDLVLMGMQAAVLAILLPENRKWNSLSSALRISLLTTLIHLADIIPLVAKFPSRLSLRTCRHVIDGQWLPQLVPYQQPLQGGNDGGVAVDLSCCDTSS